MFCLRLLCKLDHLQQFNLTQNLEVLLSFIYKLYNLGLSLRLLNCSKNGLKPFHADWNLDFNDLPVVELDLCNSNVIQCTLNHALIDFKQ